MKRLIINADDFGRTNNNNVGVVRTFEHGMVTATSLVAGGTAFEEAAAYARGHPGLDVGVHLALDEVRPILPRERIPDLVDDSGRFLPRGRILLQLWRAPSRPPPTRATAVLARPGHSLRSRLAPRPVSGPRRRSPLDRGSPSVLEQVRAEWEAQVARIVDAGLRPSHLDGHGHVHVHPRLQGEVAWLRERFDIRACRCPTESLLRAGRPRRYLEKLLVHGCGRYAGLRGQPGVFVPDHFHGFMEGGRLTPRSVEGILRRLRPGVNELMAHPGGDNRDSPFGVPYDWEGDMNALLAIDPADAQRRYGFRLIGFREAAKMAE